MALLVLSQRAVIHRYVFPYENGVKQTLLLPNGEPAVLEDFSRVNLPPDTIWMATIVSDFSGPGVLVEFSAQERNQCLERAISYSQVRPGMYVHGLELPIRSNGTIVDSIVVPTVVLVTQDLPSLIDYRRWLAVDNYRNEFEVCATESSTLVAMVGTSPVGETDYVQTVIDVIFSNYDNYSHDPTYLQSAADVLRHLIQHLAHGLGADSYTECVQLLCSMLNPILIPYGVGLVQKNDVVFLEVL